MAGERSRISGCRFSHFSAERSDSLSIVLVWAPKMEEFSRKRKGGISIVGLHLSNEQMVIVTFLCSVSAATTRKRECGHEAYDAFSINALL